MSFCPSADLSVGKQWDTKHLDDLSAKLAHGENTLAQQLRLLDRMREDKLQCFTSKLDWFDILASIVFTRKQQNAKTDPP